MTKEKKIYPDDFRFLSDFLKNQMGLVLAEDKEYLLLSRLEPIILDRELKDFSGLVRQLRNAPCSSLVNDIVEAMTINETSFFRDKKPYEDIQKIIFPLLRKNAGNRRTLRIWSAAASTGQEAYSLTISILEAQHQYPDWNVEILATDISQKALSKAIAGIYSDFEVQRGVLPPLLSKYFTALPESFWQINQNVRAHVTFKVHNLLDNFLTPTEFDLILCRNVLIYFHTETKRDVVAKLTRHLVPGGVLMVGSTESLEELTSPLSPMPNIRGAYQNPTKPHAT